MRAVFIGGAARSGTTFLGSLLGAHPLCVATPESNFKVDTLIARTSPEGKTIDPITIRSLLENVRFGTWRLELDTEEQEALERTRTVSEAMFLLARAYARVTNLEAPRVWVDHTPSNIRYVHRLREHFPGSKFIHLVRDGRAVSASILPLPFGPNTIVAAATVWMEYVAAGLAAEWKLRQDEIQRVRFEDLVGEPERELRRLCDFLQLDFRDIMVAGRGFEPESYTRSIHPLIGQPPRIGRISAWKSKLESRDIEIFEARTGDTLACLGYDLEFGWKARGPTFPEMFRMYLEEGQQRVRNKVILRQRVRKHFRQAGVKRQA